MFVKAFCLKRKSIPNMHENPFLTCTKTVPFCLKTGYEIYYQCNGSATLRKGVVCMLKIKDYALNHGVTTQAVYKQISNHKKELEGHIIKEKGTRYLDQEAIRILESYRENSPSIVVEQGNKEEVESVRLENQKLKEELLVLQKKYIDIQEENRENLKQLVMLQQKTDQLEELKNQVSSQQDVIEKVKQSSLWERIWKKW